MKAIILKDLYRQRFLLIGFIAGLAISGILPIYASALPHILILLTTVILTVIMNEATEEKDYGYTLLATLPVSRLGVITAKFLVILSICLAFSLTSSIILVVRGEHPSFFADIPTTISASFIISLVVGAITQAGTYIFGLKNFSKGMLVLAIGLQAYIFVLGLESFSGGDRVQRVMATIGQVFAAPPIPMVFIGVAFWGVLLIVTAQFRKRI